LVEHRFLISIARYTDHNYLAAVEFYEIACEFTERAVHAGDKEAEEKLQSRLTFLAEARLKSGVSATPTVRTLLDPLHFDGECERANVFIIDRSLDVSFDI
jgi:hypothetical protein